MEEDKEKVIMGEVVETDKKGWYQGMPSPNPNGRPKKEFTLTSMAKDLLKEAKAGNETKAVALMKVLIDIAEGKVTGAKPSDRVKAIQELFDRGWGKAKTFLEISTDVEFEVDWGDNNKDQIDWDKVDLLEEGNEQDTIEVKRQENPS